MPILPPRNLPLSPPSSSASGKASSKNTNENGNNKRIVSTPLRKLAGTALPSTPSPSKAGKGTINAAPSTPSSPFVHSNITAAADTSSSSIVSIPTESGQLSRQNETTFHRKLRTLLWDHRSVREQWEDVVSMEGAKSIASISRLAQRLDELIKIDQKNGTSEEYEQLPEILKISQDEIRARNLDEMKKVIKSLETEQESLSFNMQKIEKFIKKLQTLQEAGENLLIEATKSKGDVFVFEQEAWLTWPIAKFINVLQSLTIRFTLQTDHLRSLVEILNHQGCATGKDSGNQEGVAEKRQEEKEEAEEEEEENDEISEKEDESSSSKQARKRRALIRQRVMEEWQALKFLHDDRNPDSMWFEDVCEVEVGRWDER